MEEAKPDQASVTKSASLPQQGGEGGGSRTGLQGGDCLEGGILWQAGHVLPFSVFPACSVKGDEVEGFLLVQVGGESLGGL